MIDSKLFQINQTLIHIHTVFIKHNDADNLEFENDRFKAFSNQPDFDPYPHCFHKTLSLKDFGEKYNAMGLEPNEVKKDITESVSGRVLEKRSVGKKLVFYTISAGGYSLQ